MNEESKKDYGVLIAKKSEKLVTALYLVTDLISDSEPIKHGLRKNAVALLSSMNSLAQHEVKDRVLELKMSLRSVTEITSLLHVALTTGIVSKMNGELLMEGFRSLQLVLEKKQPLFTKEMLYVEDEESLEKESISQAVTSTSYDALTPLSIARLHETKEELRRNQDALRQSQILNRFERTREDKGQFIKETKVENGSSFIKDKTSDSLPKEERDEVSTPLTTGAALKEMSTHDVLLTHAARPTTSFTSSFQMKKMSRREQILALFVRGVDVSIKDIAARIKGCSEKTIQRELNTLVYDNVIERIGEKRWSRYVLK
jgi:hypothetical protein